MPNVSIGDQTLVNNASAPARVSPSVLVSTDVYVASVGNDTGVSALLEVGKYLSPTDGERTNIALQLAGIPPPPAILLLRK